MYTILIIEDTVELRENIAEVLVCEGFEVLQAGNGIAGIELALKHSPDLILCDIMMPGPNGFEVLKSLKYKGDQLQVPFIFISALDERKDIREGMGLGADDYLVKPFTIKELLTAIQVRIEKHQSLESRIKSRIESIESELLLNISELETLVDSQKVQLDQAVTQKELATEKLKEKQELLMQDALRSIEINNIIQELTAQLNFALQKNNLTEDQRITLSGLRNKLRNKSILLNNQTVFLFKFEQTYPNFKLQLLRRYPKLKKQDLALLVSTYLNLDTNQQGAILNITSESVRKKRYRLKLKIGLGKEQELADFFQKMIQ
jgi:DNA-binding response OmpR family regulator